MSKRVVPLALGLVFSASTVFASGWRIPEQSVNSTALSAAYVAHTTGADASYFNPAAMAWLEDRLQVEGDLTGIRLTTIDYTDSRSATLSGSSEGETFLLPQIHLVSQKIKQLRFGFSLTYPGGLAKRWQDPYPRRYAEEFSLKVVEANPSVAYAVNDRVALAVGVRGLYADGTVKSYAANVAGPGTYVSRDLDGDTTELGYNLALSCRVTDRFRFGATYRSKVDLDLEGNATLADNVGAPSYNGPARVSVPQPAVLALGVSYDFGRTTVELAFDRTYWSAYKNLDFNYNTTFGPGHPFYAFDASIPKDWSDVNAYRIGITHRLNDQWTLMAGFAIDNNPVPDKSLGFELPDSDSRIYSLGCRYRYNEHLDAGLAYLYDDKGDRTVNNTAEGGGVDGHFEGAAAHLVSLGFTCLF
ncbi:MAG: outer membrane protein transport protein [Desulfobacteraceae bacterium]|nr:outer membrane protein transport protein [Desulfobacteraceae bacterium]